MAGAPHEMATGLCRFCFVALCKPHLIELYGDPPSFPQYTCRHSPASRPAPLSGRRADVGPQRAEHTERLRAPAMAPGFGSL